MSEDTYSMAEAANVLKAAVADIMDTVKGSSSGATIESDSEGFIRLSLGNTTIVSQCDNDGKVVFSYVYVNDDCVAAFNHFHMALSYAFGILIAPKEM
jgi:hypothetical protein